MNAPGTTPHDLCGSLHGLAIDGEPNVYATAVRRLNAAREEVERLEAFIAMYERFLRPTIQYVDVPIVERTPRKSALVRPRCRFTEDNIVQAAHDLLLDGHPRSAGRILAELAARGVHIDGARPRGRIVTAILRKGPGKVRHTPLGYTTDPQP